MQNTYEEGVFIPIHLTFERLDSYEENNYDKSGYKGAILINNVNTNGNSEARTKSQQYYYVGDQFSPWEGVGYTGEIVRGGTSVNKLETDQTGFEIAQSNMKSALGTTVGNLLANGTYWVKARTMVFDGGSNMAFSIRRFASGKYTYKIMCKTSGTEDGLASAIRPKITFWYYDVGTNIDGEYEIIPND